MTSMHSLISEHTELSITHKTLSKFIFVCLLNSNNSNSVFDSVGVTLAAFIYLLFLCYKGSTLLTTKLHVALQTMLQISELSTVVSRAKVEAKGKKKWTLRNSNMCINLKRMKRS